MYICVCNVIREADFRRAAQEHAGDVEAIYAAMGFEPQCGQCVEHAKLLLKREREGQARAVHISP